MYTTILKSKVVTHVTKNSAIVKLEERNDNREFENSFLYNNP